MKKHNGRGYVRQKYCELCKRNQSYCHLLSVGPGRHSFNSRASHFCSLLCFPCCSPILTLSTPVCLCPPSPRSQCWKLQRQQDLLQKHETSSSLFVLTPEPLATTLHLQLASPAKCIKKRVQIQQLFFHPSSLLLPVTIIILCVTPCATFVEGNTGIWLCVYYSDLTKLMTQ